jgi:hypothetical protein
MALALPPKSRCKVARHWGCAVYVSTRNPPPRCLVCRHEIGPYETEYDVDGAGVVLIAHELCYTLWREESVSHRQENRS